MKSDMDKQHFLNRIGSINSTNFEKYNYDLLPETFKANDKLPIECIIHGVFYQKYISHLYNQGCPTCGRIKGYNARALTTNDFIIKSKSKFGEKFNYSKTNYTRKGNVLTLTCPIHKDFVIRPEAHIWSKHGCPKCDYEIPRSIKKSKYINKAKRIHNNRYNYSRVHYENSRTVTEIICPVHGLFRQNFFNHATLGIGCPKCALEKDKLTLSNFISRSKEIHKNKYSYSKVFFKDVASKITITCDEHGDFTQRAASHLAGNKCMKCSHEENRLSNEEFIDKAKKVHGDKYDYSKVKYHGNKRPVEIICSKHGSFWQKPNSHTSSMYGCQLCYESKGEVAIELFLKKYNIRYIREYRIIPHLYRYDFYLPDLNIYIEFNGVQHYKPISIFGGLEGHSKIKHNDKVKKHLVNQNNGCLIILTYLNLNDGSLEKVLISKLKYAYNYWFVINNKIHIFKNSGDVIESFKIPKDVLIRNIPNEVKKIVNEFNVLF